MADLKPHERAALDARGLTPLPFPCVGAELGDLRPHTHGECFSCADWSRGGAGQNRAALVKDSRGVRRCANHRPLLSAGQVAAMDETAGLHGGCTVPGLQPAQVSPESQSVDAASTRAGEGGACAL